MAEMEYTLGGHAMYPAGVSYGLSVTSGGGAYGSYAQMIASTSSDIYVTGVTIKSAQIINNFGNYTHIIYTQCAIATGASGSETIKAEAKVVGFYAFMDSYDNKTYYYTGGYTPFNPPLKIPSGTRIVCKVADNVGGKVYFVTLHYISTSDITNPILSEVINPTGEVISDGSNSTTTFKTNLTETTNDFWKDCYLKFTSGSLTNQVKKVTGYNGTTKFITCEAFTSVPSTDTFELINQ